MAIVAGVFDGAAGGLGVPVEMWHALRQGLGGVVILVALGGLFAWGFGEAYLAALSGCTRGQECRAEIALEMTAREIAEAQRQARAWLATTSYGRRAA